MSNLTVIIKEKVTVLSTYIMGVSKPRTVSSFIPSDGCHILSDGMMFVRWYDTCQTGNNRQNLAKYMYFYAEHVTAAS